ncbi:hypothetical protein [Helicobacter mustelae]|uniref:hypothetical protein n=1 Tax=Helicobacter mustelae TaxID=217 RepID=UPI001305266F|nr:hypothetical protein [Helicobacter mustelae]
MIAQKDLAGIAHLFCSGIFPIVRHRISRGLMQRTLEQLLFNVYQARVDASNTTPPKPR